MIRKPGRILFFLLLIPYPLFLNAQDHIIDSLKAVVKTQAEDTNKVNTLNKLSDKLWRTGNYDTSLIYSNSSQALANKLGYKKGLAGAYRNVGIVYANQGNYPKALDNFFKALAISRELGNKLHEAFYLNYIGIIYMNQGDYPNALQYYFNALAINKETGNKMYAALNLGNIGCVYDYQGNDSGALEYHFKALAINQELKDKSGISINLNNIGHLYYAVGNYPKALEYDFKALDLFKELGNENSMATNMCNIGLAYMRQKEYPKALEYYFKALAIDTVTGDKSGIAANLCNIGGTYMGLKNYAKARGYIDSALTLSKNIGDKELIKNNYEDIAILDSVAGNYKQALADYKYCIVYRDSLVNEANTKKTVQAEMNYQFEQQQVAEKAEQDKKDAKQRIITMSVVSGLLLVLVFAGFIFRSLRITRKQKSLIEVQKAEVEKKNIVIEEKNKDILDSITYAKRLQDAILPPLSLVKQYLPDSFLLYKPKDIVAGDFYWMERSPLLTGEGKGEVVLIAAADCTGHGVPGAMVSVVCSNALNRAVKEFGITEPGKILDKVRELVLETFSHRDPFGEQSENNVQDGMDISLASLTPSKGGIQIQWAGAYNSLWYVENGEMKEVAADKQPIGKTDNPKPFTTHTITINPPSEGRGAGALYLLTDGYADQFGGPKGKKFKYKQLQEFLLANSSKPMDNQKNLLETTLEGWKGNLEQVDDVLIIGIRV